MATTTEIKRGGFELVTVAQPYGLECSIYREGKQVPLYRKLIADAAKAEAWFTRQIAREAGR